MQGYSFSTRPHIVTNVVADTAIARHMIGALGPFPAVASPRQCRRLTEKQANVITPQRLQSGDAGVQHIYRKDIDGAGKMTVDPFRYLGMWELVEKCITRSFGVSPVGAPLELAINCFLPSGSELAVHTDIPYFTGLESGPRWLRLLMFRSGLFKDWYIPCATCLLWFYEGPGGEFRFWDRGPQYDPSCVTHIDNTLMVCETDYMSHGVSVTGDRDFDLSLAELRDSTLSAGSSKLDDWTVETSAGPKFKIPSPEIRITLNTRYRLTSDGEKPFEALTVEKVMTIFVEHLLSHGVKETAISNVDDLVEILNGMYPAPTPLGDTSPVERRYGSVTPQG